MSESGPVPEAPVDPERRARLATRLEELGLPPAEAAGVAGAAGPGETARAWARRVATWARARAEEG